MQQHFEGLVAHLEQGLAKGEAYTLSLEGEHSDFVRMNRGRVRQPGVVHQAVLTLRLIEGQRHASATTVLSGDAAEDRSRIDAAVSRLRARLPHLPEDPHLLLADVPQSTRDDRPGRLADPVEAVDTVLDAAEAEGGLDLVGIYAAGEIQRGFAASTGQRNWFSARTWNLDWSVVDAGGSAVKRTQAGFDWDPEAVRAEVADAGAQLAVMRRERRVLSPGSYRAYLAPAALEEILGVLRWGGFGLKARRTRDSTLQHLVDGKEQLSPMVSLREHTAGGSAPAFNEAGFLRPDSVPLIHEGRSVGALVSPRTAREYGEPTNGADAMEQPASLDMAPGTLPTADVLQRLGTGLWIGNLWYLNYSDRSACRITGMTRFATLWVEDGEIVGPVEALRFDDTLYRILGPNLEALTTETAFRASTSTYFERSTASMRLPGALLGELVFTL